MKGLYLILMLFPFVLGAQEVFRNIESTVGREHEVEYLVLTGRKYQEIPADIKKLKNLKSLTIKRAALNALPDWLDQLAITSLDLTKNRLTEIPPVVFRMTGLEKLYLGNNKITNLPPEIEHLQQLKELELWANEIADIPIELQNIPNLELLDLRSITYNANEQAYIRGLLPNTDVKLSLPCNCN